MLARLKSYQIKFLKVKLTNTDNATGSRTTPACVRLNQTQTGLRNLHMIDKPRGICDPEFKRKEPVRNQESRKHKGKCATKLD